MADMYHEPSRPPQWPLRPWNQLPPLPLAMRPRKAAAALGVSLSTLERLTASGELGVVRLGRCRLYEVEELKAWLTRNRVGGRVAGQEVAS